MKMYVGDKDLHQRREKLMRRDRWATAAKRVLAVVFCGALLYAYIVVLFCM